MPAPLIAAGVAIAARLAAKKAAQEAAKKVAKKAAAKAAAKKAAAKKAAAKTEKIARNSVKVDPKNSAAFKKRINRDSELRAILAQSGTGAAGRTASANAALARARAAGYKPKIVKINSGR
jgi:hypothetical protein